MEKVQSAKEYYQEYERKSWTPARGKLMKQELSTAYGLYPFTTEHRRVTRKMCHSANHGRVSTIYINKETDVQIVYMYSKVRFFDMSNPKDNKEYWAGRAATKAAFVKTFYGRK